MVWSDYLPKKSLLGGGEWWWQTKFNVSPGPGLWSLVLGPFGPDLGPDLDLTWTMFFFLKLDLYWGTFWKKKIFKASLRGQFPCPFLDLTFRDSGLGLWTGTWPWACKFTIYGTYKRI